MPQGDKSSGSCALIGGCAGGSAAAAGADVGAVAAVEAAAGAAADGASGVAEGVGATAGAASGAVGEAATGAAELGVAAGVAKAGFGAAPGGGLCAETDGANDSAITNAAASAAPARIAVLGCARSFCCMWLFTICVPFSRRGAAAAYHGVGERRCYNVTLWQAALQATDGFEFYFGIKKNYCLFSILRSAPGPVKPLK